jgi:hypothetical protein
VTGDQESELQRRCPSEVANRRKRIVRACTGDARKERRGFGHERGAPRDARDGFVTWIPTKTDRPAHPRWETNVEPDDAPSRVASRSADRRRRGRSFFAPAHPLGTSGSERFIGTAKARGRPRRIAMLATEVSPHPSNGARAARSGGERATRGAIGACSVGHRGESRRIRPSATMKDAFST